MANVQKQVLGAVSSWTLMNFTASDFNSRASGQIVVETSDTTNATNLDLEGQISFTLEVGGTTTVSSVLQFLAMELHQNGSTYGCGTATGGTNPAAHQVLTVANVKNSVTSGNAVTGITRWFPMPIGVFRFAVLQGLGSITDSSANAAFYLRTRNMNLNG